MGVKTETSFGIIDKTEVLVAEDKQMHHQVCQASNI